MAVDCKEVTHCNSSTCLLGLFCAQVSVILTNHLNRAIDQWNPDDIMSCDPLQDTLTMLLGLSRSQMGRDVLSQPVCVSQLLTLLLDKRWVGQEVGQGVGLPQRCIHHTLPFILARAPALTASGPPPGWCW